MSEKEIYLITGGPSADAKQRIMDFKTALQSCGKPQPKVAYVGTASNDSKVFFHLLKKSILKAGAKEVVLAPIADKHADIETAKQILSEADAIFLTGGEVEDGMLWLKKYNLDVFLTDLYKHGKLFFGLSAGCIMMGQHWVHWDIEDDDSTSSLFDCLNFVPMTFDAHGENEDWKELKCALRLLGSGADGYGLSDGGFYCVDSEGHLTSFRNGPSIYSNIDGNITRKA